MFDQNCGKSNEISLSIFSVSPVSLDMLPFLCFPSFSFARLFSMRIDEANACICHFHAFLSSKTYTAHVYINGNLFFSYISSRLGLIWFTKQAFRLMFHVRFSICSFCYRNIQLRTHWFQGTSIAFMRNEFHLLAIRLVFPVEKRAALNRCAPKFDKLWWVCCVYSIILKGEDYCGINIQCYSMPM